MESSRTEIEKKVIDVIRKFLLESAAKRALSALSLSASLEHDLGIGSLERTELLGRIEKSFGVRLPDTVFVEADKVKDLVDALQKARPDTKQFAAEYVSHLRETTIDPSQASTLVEILLAYAKKEPNRPHIYLQGDSRIEQTISYGRLLEAAARTANGLIELGLKVGDTVAIMLPTSADFFYAFYGVLLAGGIPVPIYPPFRPDRIEAYTIREASIFNNAGVRILITFSQAKTLSHLLKAFVPSLKAIVNVEHLMSHTSKTPPVDIEPTDPALIQYTSGSTGNPKGVLLNHQNILSNIKLAGLAIGITAQDVGVSWLPLYHDMGLMNWLGSLYFGLPIMILSPLSFLMRPERWLWAIHYHRGTYSAGPNFAYELCVNKIDESLIDGLDLSSWRLAFNGAETINANTIRRFIKKFEPYGFRPTACFPVYGLAESTVALAFSVVGEKPKIDKIERETFIEEQRAVPLIETKQKNISGSKTFLEFVSCGRAIPEHEIRVVDENNEPLPERVVGNLQFRGPSAMRGYYRNPEATKKVFHDGWWDTGDYAYIADEDVYITGRKKDIIIKAGRNLHPEEIEEMVSQVAGIRKGCVIAFGVEDEKTGTEKLIVVAETRESGDKNQEKLYLEVNERMVASIGLPPDETIFVSPRTIPKTSSGKLQRSACKRDYMQGKLRIKQLPIYLQMLKLIFSWGLNRITGIFKSIGKLFYLFYLVLLFVLIVFPGFIIVVLLPRKQAASFIRYACRILLWLSGCPIKVNGLDKINRKQTVVLVANHASYVDPLVLLSVIPFDFKFIGKQELLKDFFIRYIFQKLKYIVVNRDDFLKTMEDTEVIKRSLLKGHSLMIYPEGTFTYATGLRPFKMGAFVLAAQTNTTILPIGMIGPRYVLRDGEYLPKPRAITVNIGDPITPSGSEWSDAVNLREQARMVIAELCGEATIDLIKAGHED